MSLRLVPERQLLKAVAVHHLAGMQLLLFSRYILPFRCSCGCCSREHESLISGNFYVWLNCYVPYRETHWFIPKNTRAILGAETYTLHWATPKTEIYNYVGQIQEPKFCTCYSGRCLGPKCRFGAGIKTLSWKTCTSPPTFSNHVLWFVADFPMFVSHIPE
jgi:hypothetical protein